MISIQMKTSIVHNLTIYYFKSFTNKVLSSYIFLKVTYRFEVCQINIVNLIFIHFSCIQVT